MCIKLRWLGPTNWIINDSDFKPSEFQRRNMSDSKSDVEIGLRLKEDVEIQLNMTNCWLKLLKLVLFLIKNLLKAI